MDEKTQQNDLIWMVVVEYRDRAPTILFDEKQEPRVRAEGWLIVTMSNNDKFAAPSTAVTKVSILQVEPDVRTWTMEQILRVYS